MGALRVLAVVLLGLDAGAAVAGAWPREEGETFLSFSNLPVRDSDGRFSSWVGLYAERGLTPRLTLGLDGDRPSDGENWSVWGFLRWDLSPGAKVQRALSFGVGVRGADGGIDPVFRPGFAIGRALSTPWGPGWVEAEALAIHAPGPGWTAWKLDGTIGVRPSERQVLMLQAQVSDWPDSDVQLRLIPSVVTEIAPGISVEIGIAAEVAEPRTLGLKLGTWLEF
jgi:hypothetical protein